jgi:hypothetical protein
LAFSPFYQPPAEKDQQISGIPSGLPIYLEGRDSDATDTCDLKEKMKPFTRKARLGMRAIERRYNFPSNPLRFPGLPTGGGLFALCGGSFTSPCRSSRFSYCVSPAVLFSVRPHVY